jgi:hypothetical protein
MMRMARFTVVLVATFVLLMPRQLVASSVEGRVVNRTLNQPSPGDEVRLFEYGTTLREEDRTVSDSQGSFQFERSKATPFMVIVVHQNVAYHSSLLAGSEPVDVAVYDSVQLSNSAHEDGEALFVEADTQSVKVTQFFVLSNLSEPPRTFLGASTFDFVLPSRAVLDSLAAQPGGSLPSATRPLRLTGSNHFGISDPIRPGITKIVATYHVPRSNKIVITPNLLRPIGFFKVMLPASMQFISGRAYPFVRGEESGIVTQMARNVRPGSGLSFSISGLGDIRALSAAAREHARRTLPVPPAPAIGSTLVQVQSPAQDHKLGANVVKTFTLAIVLLLILMVVLLWRRPPRLNKTS